MGWIFNDSKNEKYVSENKSNIIQRWSSCSNYNTQTKFRPSEPIALIENKPAIQNGKLSHLTTVNMNVIDKQLHEETPQKHLRPRNVHTVEKNNIQY